MTTFPSDVLLAVPELHARLGALEHDVLVAQVDPEPAAQHLVAQADREERLPRRQQPVDGARERGDLGVVGLARVAGSAATSTPSGSSPEARATNVL